MGRKVKRRVNYRQDAMNLINLQQAIELDNRRSPAWRKSCAELCSKLSLMLMKADTESFTDPKSKEG